MTITEVTDDRTLRDWTRLPWRIYADDTNWIPHLKQDVEKVFDRKKNKLLDEKAHPGGGIARWVLYSKEGVSIGRIAAFVNPKTAHSDAWQPTGGCGFFECIDDQAAANLLFDTARDWLQARGMEAMDGPINLGDRNMFWGLLIENFIDPPIYGNGYNLPYYVRLFEKYGFTPYFEQLLYRRSAKDPVPDAFFRVYDKYMTNPDFEVKTARYMWPWKIARDFRTVLNDAWAGFPEFRPMSSGRARKQVLDMWPVMDGRIIVFLYHKGKPIACFVNIPELNEIFKHINGNKNLVGYVKVFWHLMRGTSKTMNGRVFGVVKAWQNKGMETLMIAHLSKWLTETGRYGDTVLTWIGSFNLPMLSVCEKLEAKCYRTLATYRYTFDRSKPPQRHPIIEKKKAQPTNS